MTFVKKYAPLTPDKFIWSSDKAEADILDYLPSPEEGLGDLHPLLLHGSYGGGKTELMKRLPGWIDPNFNKLNELWIVADARKNISEMVKTVTRFSQFAPFGGGLKALLIDEADNLDIKIQQGLKGQITEIVGQDTDVLIIMATNHIDKMDGGLVSRCVTVDMTQRDPERFLPKMRDILKAEKVDMMSDRALLSLAENAGTDIRELYRLMEDLVADQRALQAISAAQPIVRRTGFTLLKQPVS